MIIWIASYPKSGNTWMRLFIKSYFNPQNKKFSLNRHEDDPFLIQTFPTEGKFDELKIKYEDFFEISKNWINLQSLINLNNKTNYLKTHNAMCTINNNKFTNIHNTLGAIYVVRDPRDVLVSYSNYMDKSIDETIEILLSDDTYEYGNFKDKGYRKSLIGSWSSHYNSWKNYKSKETIIVKYEDMLYKSNSTFLRVLNYIGKINNIEIDKNKMYQAIEETSFENLKKLEKSEGFKSNVSKNPFFRKGRVGDWKEKLTKEQTQRIEKFFKVEMIELGYL
ncbi:sulfotransferase domain-containing protein [Candidatus Pelagibacter sp.]|nr:sulfotransferase domain-containing protein [Candidatus Pelagibacter sp.]